MAGNAKRYTAFHCVGRAGEKAMDVQGLFVFLKVFCVGHAAVPAAVSVPGTNRLLEILLCHGWSSWASDMTFLSLFARGSRRRSEITSRMSSPVKVAIFLAIR